MTRFVDRGEAPEYRRHSMRDWSIRKRLFGSPDQATPQDHPGAERHGCIASQNADIIKQWYEIVAEDFMGRQFTDESDRLPALLGIGSRVQELTGSKYLDGHFEHQILQSLLWYNTIPECSKVDASFMPSWSWVSARAQRSFGTTIDLDGYLELFAKYLGARRLEGPYEGNDEDFAKHYQLCIQGYMLSLGCTSGLSVMLDRPERGWYQCHLCLARATPSDAAPLRYEEELRIEIVTDQPYGLDHMFSGALDSDPEEGKVCCDRFDSSVFLLPIGTTIYASRSLGGLLVQVLDKRNRIYRRIGTFWSRHNSLVNDLTPEEFLAALFENEKEETVWLS